MIEAVCFFCLLFKLLRVNRVHEGEIVSKLGQELDLKGGCRETERFTALEVLVGIGSILKSGLVVLRHEGQITQVAQLELCLVHPEAIFQAVILASVCFLEDRHHAVLESLPCLGDCLLQGAEPRPDEGHQVDFNDLPHVTVNSLPILRREDLASDLAR